MLNSRYTINYLSPAEYRDSSEFYGRSAAHFPFSTITNPTIYLPFVLLFLIHLLHCCRYLLFALSHSNPFTLPSPFAFQKYFSISPFLFCSCAFSLFFDLLFYILLLCFFLCSSVQTALPSTDPRHTPFIFSLFSCMFTLLLFFNQALLKPSWLLTS